jgi:guanylate kinase
MLVIISGPSGVGKDTIIEELRMAYPDPDPGRDYVVTCTTRARRENEIEGVSYHFLSTEGFVALRDHGALLEYAEVHGNWYGTPRDQVVNAISAGRDAILKIDVQGERAVHARVPEAVTIFVVPPSLEELERRLIERGTETPEDLERRLANARAELEMQANYDHVVINETDRSRETAEEIHRILQEEHQRQPDRRVSV